MTFEELEALRFDTPLWDKDYGLCYLVEFKTEESWVMVRVQEENMFTWVEDLTLATSLQQELE